jgi:hypothetical protein
MPAFLTVHGIECPPHYNPADVVIDVVAARNPKEIEELIADHADAQAKLGNSSDKVAVADDFAPLADSKDSSLLSSLFYGYNTSFITQFAVIFHRTCLHTVRSPALFQVHYIVIILLAILLGYDFKLFFFF